MLVLTRKPQQKITVGPVTFTIIKIGDNTVRVGIDAPLDYTIARDDMAKGPPEPPAT